jgi:hypothetical protein
MRHSACASGGCPSGMRPVNRMCTPASTCQQVLAHRRSFLLHQVLQPALTLNISNVLPALFGFKTQTINGCAEQRLL